MKNHVLLIGQLLKLPEASVTTAGEKYTSLFVSTYKVIALPQLQKIVLIEPALIDKAKLLQPLDKLCIEASFYLFDYLNDTGEKLSVVELVASKVTVTQFNN